jgi:hypothetical protein
LLYSLGADMDSATNTAVVKFLNGQANSTPTELPLSFFKSGQFLCLTPDCKGGLILQKPFYADFVGPGAAGSSFDINCTSVYVIGTVEFYVPETYEKRQKAFQKRMAYSKRLQDIAGVETPIHRCLLMLHQLCQWVGVKEMNKVPDELIARLAGALTKTVKFARKKYATTPPKTAGVRSQESGVRI